MRRKLVIGNWKMNGSLAANSVLLRGIVEGYAAKNADCAVCVPAPYLAQCQAELQGTPVAWGAQDVSAYAAGAYTGETAASMLQDFGCRYVICGHSERRAYHHESNELVAQKALAALNAGLTPIVCVGETLEQREAGRTNVVVCAQLQAVLDVLENPALEKIVLAYEPVWAIGTGKTATPAMAQEVHALLRKQVGERNPAAAATVPILYGGSMKPENAKDLLGQPDIDGGLIGGAALKAKDFLAIVDAGN
ncbi:triose-phosphate isomerase [Pseudoduganella flava]|uniref:Triosephosphate isomerase n=2 Tax=Pseudoduganella flava TaxID=871742 RepID=A0ABX6FTY2_9BURK|nr:triose-phosphate isomerase [Pseudoduganella flava]QGZ38852.1 triose-phosphate isomerase [Pseudoduganella flava]